jgi:murein DD-endopeptidase MepM/ murein hydrolase activator NlpD
VTSAVDKLRSSHLTLTQRELMGEDVDLGHLYLALNHKGIDIIEAVKDVMIERTIDGASTVTVEVEDRNYTLLRSGRLSSRNDIELDGLYFRMFSVEKQDTALTLTFLDREVALLQTYEKPIKQSLATSRKKMTRAQFALRLIREVREVKIKTFIPELNVTQPVQGVPDPRNKTSTVTRDLGIPRNNDLTVKGAPMTEEQRRNAEGVLDVGRGMLVPRKALVMAMMCVIQESTVQNLLGGDRDSVGLFQQRRSQGWPATRIVATDAAEFFRRLMSYLGSHPNAQYWEAVQGVQISANGHLYAQWRTEAERIVSGYGVLDGTAADANAQYNDIGADTGDYEFYRGQPPTRKRAAWGRENSWDCLKRLAGEVNWRAFFVSGTFYWISEDRLLKSKPIAVIDEDTPGIISINGNYTVGAKSASLTVQCFMSKWAAPPGSVIQIKNTGPWNGRWLVSTVRRSAFSRQGEIVLKKKSPRLPEPGGSNLAGTGSSASGTWTGTDVAPAKGKQFRTPGGFVQPVPAGHNTHIVQGVHPTANLAGFPACDFGADAGAPIIAVESGTIYKISGHDPSTGPSDPLMGVHGPFGWSCYLQGDSGSRYYYTHMGNRTVAVQQNVRAGEQIGTVGDYARWGGTNHVHVGVNEGEKGPSVEDLMNAPLVRG